MKQPLYMGGKISAAYKMSVLGKEMAQMNETLTATTVILKNRPSVCTSSKGQRNKKSSRHVQYCAYRVTQERCKRT